MVPCGQDFIMCFLENLLYSLSCKTTIKFNFFLIITNLTIEILMGKVHVSKTYAYNFTLIKVELVVSFFSDFVVTTTL